MNSFLTANAVSRVGYCVGNAISQGKVQRKSYSLQITAK